MDKFTYFQLLNAKRNRDKFLDICYDSNDDINPNSTINDFHSLDYWNHIINEIRNYLKHIDKDYRRCCNNFNDWEPNSIIINL